MSPYMKHATAKLVYILENLDQFTKTEVIHETGRAVDQLVNDSDSPSVEMLGGFQSLAMAIQRLKCADC